MLGVVVVSCGVLPWRRSGFGKLAAFESLDDNHRAAAFRARLRLVSFISIDGMLFVGFRTGIWFSIQQPPDHLDPVAADAVSKESAELGRLLQPVAELSLQFGPDHRYGWCANQGERRHPQKVKQNQSTAHVRARVWRMSMIW